MIFLYGGLLVAIVTVVTGAVKTAQVIDRRAKALPAPMTESQRLKTRGMRVTLRREEKSFGLLKDRFNMDFEDGGSVEGNAVIKAELLSIKKALARASFQLAAYSTNTDAAFCKELARNFNKEIATARAKIKNVSQIWTDSY
jgi:hypothetical protein